jgi:translation initiation factor IF-2
VPGGFLERTLAKGIRLNQLAKDLGVQSKAILDVLKTEGLSDVVPNHQSTISLGLAETIKEWHNAGRFAGGGGVALEEPPAKAKAAKGKKKSAGDDHAGADEAPHADDESTSPPADASAAPATPAAPVVEAKVTPPAEAAPAAPAAPATAVAAPATPTTPAAPAAPMAPAATVPTAAQPTAPGVPAGSTGLFTPPAQRPAAAAPAAPAAAAPTPAAPKTVVPPVVRPGMTAAQLRAGLAAGPAAGQGPVTRPTIKLGDGSTPRPNAPPPFVPKKAEVRGPQVIREEKPDIVPTPRPRRAPGMGPPGTGGPPSPFGGPRSTGGRGVKSTDDGDDEQKKAAAKKTGLSVRRRGPDGRRGEADEKLKEFTEADLIARRDALNAATDARKTFDAHLKRSQRGGAGPVGKNARERGEPIQLEEPITAKSLSEATGLKVRDIISKLMRQGVMATINQPLDIDTAQLIAMEFGLAVEIARQTTLEQLFLEMFEAYPVKEENLRPRPPVVTILGHVDHGKTSLLDRIRKANVAAGEAGGITQHTAAWMVTLGEGETQKRVTFIDTPGHQAFTAMRARGANMTDIVVLVVSAAEGVQPQTVESINHAKAAGVPIVVAMNKIDRDDANPDMVLGQLAGNGLNPVEWGGDTEVVRTSAVTGQGIEQLIEILDLQSQVLELKADPTAPTTGTVIEARTDAGLGPVATVLVQNGTLKPGDVILCGNAYGRIRALRNDQGQTVPEAGPSTPVIVSGLNELPGAGDRYFQIDDFDQARQIAEERAMLNRQQQLADRNKVTLSGIFDTLKAGEIRTINLIIKGDVAGSVETLAKTVTDQNTDEVRVKVIHAAVGAITESDVELADASDAVIIGFHVVPEESARAMAEQRHIEIRTYRVIYEIYDDLKKALSGMLEPEIREKLHGNVEVRQIFKISRLGNIGGCFVTDGHVSRGSKVRVIRDGVVMVEDLSIDTLRRLKDDVKEVKAGLECGIKLANYDDIKVGDRLQAYVKETFQRTL